MARVSRCSQVIEVVAAVHQQVVAYVCPALRDEAVDLLVGLPRVVLGWHYAVSATYRTLSPVIATCPHRWWWRVRSMVHCTDEVAEW